MEPIPVPPPDCGQRLIPTLIDEIACTNPEKTFASIPLSLDVRDGFRDISYLQFANAINRCAWWMEAKIGRGQNLETLAYMGPTDLRYAIILIAAVKTGHKAFFPSPRNNIEGHLSLLAESQCNHFLVPQIRPPILGDILSRRPMKVVTVPETEDWLDGDHAPHYPYNKSFAEARHEPFVVFHTSGSTGTPKIVPSPHGLVTIIDAYKLIPLSGSTPTIFSALRDTRLFLGFPLFHAAGIGILLPFNIYFGITTVLPPAVPLTADIADQVHATGAVSGSALIPSILDEIAKTPPYLENLRNLQYVVFGGSPLPRDVGDVIRTRARLYTLMGSTETHTLPTLPVDKEDWEYLSFSPYAGCEFRHHAEDLYELVIVRDEKLDLFQGIFTTFPDLHEYPMKDLYSKHPSKPGLWLYRGRTDDIIVLSNGEKLNPLGMEKVIASHPQVLGCLVVGQGKFETALLVEPKQSPKSDLDKANLLSSIWSFVQRANQDCPAHGRVSKDLIMFTVPDKPMVRTGKGSVQRKMTIDSYREEIEALYTAAEGSTQTKVSWNIDVQDMASLCSSLSQLIVHTTSLKDFDSETNLFSLGLDSLQVIRLVREINSILGKHVLRPKLIYANPTVGELATVLLSSRTHAEAGVEKAGSKNRFQKMQSIFKRYSFDFPITVRPTVATTDAGMVILLTGSSGSVGSYVFDALLADPKVRKIYCLSRADGGEQRQRQIQAARGLKVSWDPERASFQRYDLSQPYFGLPHSAYINLLRNVTHILHVAWAVDFNLSIDLFADNHIYGVRQFIDFSTRSAMGARVFFISSVSTAMGSSNPDHKNVPEQAFEDWTVPLPVGYAESKFVAERLLQEAAKVAGVPSAICRVGQVAGPTTSIGMWGKQEWLPSVIASSKYLGKLPASLGPLEVVDWIPVDILARIIMDLLHGDEDGTPMQTSLEELRGIGDYGNDTGLLLGNANLPGNCHASARVFHVVNPSKTTWSELLPAVLQHAEASLEVVSFDDWVHALRQSSTKSEHIRQNPALKLIDFFEDLQKSAGRLSPTLDTTKTVRQSETMASLGPVTPKWIATWMTQWAF